MILSGLKIREEIQRGTIHIEPFREKQLNPNSYNLRLHDELLVYSDDLLDVKKPNAYEILRIPPEGIVLKPGTLYLGRTMEFTRTEKFVPTGVVWCRHVMPTLNVQGMMSAVPIACAITGVVLLVLLNHLNRYLVVQMNEHVMVH